MARASVAVDREASGWVMRVSTGGGGSGVDLALQTLPLRLKPPIEEQEVTARELAAMPGLEPEPGCPGVDAQGKLMPWFGSGSGGTGIAAVSQAATGTARMELAQAAALPFTEQQCQQQPARAMAAQAQDLPEARSATPAAAAAVQGAAAAAAAAADAPPAGKQPLGPGAAAEAAKAAALAAPARKRLRKAGEVGSPRGSGSPAPSPRDQRPAPNGTAQQDGSTDAAPPLGSPSPAPGEQAEPSGGGGSGGSGGAFGGARSGEEEQEGEDLEETQQQDKFDTQCALCDNGGILLACDGPCMRSFHADLEDGDGSGCNMLLLPLDLARHLANSNETLLCPNCLAGKHQCYICKGEGKADEEVFKCINASCGRHYHPECVGEEKGQPFVCPLHTCTTCGGYAEEGPSKEGELVPCRRCPIAYHRRCLPADLPRCRDRPEGRLLRVWLADYDEQEETWLDGVEQSLCYCQRHRINAETQQAEFEIGPAGRLYDKGWQRPYSLVNKKLLGRFRLHYAREYRHLESSRKLLAGYAAKKAAKASEEERKAQQAQRGAAEQAGSEEDVPLLQKKRRLVIAGSTAAAAPGAACDSEENVPLRQKKRKLHKAGAAAAGQPKQQAAAAAAGAAAAAPARAGTQAKAAAVKGAAPAAPAESLAAAAAQALRRQPEAQAAVTAAAAAEDEQRKETVSAGSTEDAAGTEDAAEAGGLIEAGEEVLQPLLPAGARPGALALPPAGPARAAAAAEEAASPRRIEQRRLQEVLDRLLPLPSREKRRQRVQRLLQEAEDDPRLTKDALWHATRRPEPYRHAMKKTIDEGKLANFENAVRHALTGRVPAHQLLDRAAVQSIVSHYDDLFMVLAPYLHGERYSSYGRHFTSQSLLHSVADRLAMFLRSGDQVVDFSCGENHFVPYLKQRCLSMGMAIRGRAYDIILAKDGTDFVLKSWFDTRPQEEGLAPKEQLCICLNPPFGKNNTLADKFVLHAAVQFQPRLIALIVPPRTVIPAGYQVVLENNKMCGGEEFYVPGSTHRSWNKEWPLLRILMRHECSPSLAHLGEPTEFAELLDCTAAVHAQHAQHAQQYQQQYAQQLAAGAAPAAVYPPQYAAVGVPPLPAQQQQPQYPATEAQPWGYSGAYGWPG
ncbi:hypothetical protein ABPG75_008261 [Micractinium tetrahymenae]